MNIVAYNPARDNKFSHLVQETFGTDVTIMDTFADFMERVSEPQTNAAILCLTGDDLEKFFLEKLTPSHGGEYLPCAVIGITTRAEMMNKKATERIDNRVQAGILISYNLWHLTPDVLDKLTKATLEQYKPAQQPEQNIGASLVIDREFKRAILGGTELELNPRTFDVLELLCRTPDQKVSTDEMLSVLDIKGDNLRQQIKSLKTVLDGAVPGAGAAIEYDSGRHTRCLNTATLDQAVHDFQEPKPMGDEPSLGG